MTKYIVTCVEGDTYNIPSYHLIECEKEKLIEELDSHFPYDKWLHNGHTKIYEVSREIRKSELILCGEQRQ